MRTLFPGISLTLICALAVLFALFQTDRARHDVLFAPRIQYAQHLQTPATADTLFEYLRYRPANIRTGRQSVPRHFLSGLPSDMRQAKSIRQRKSRFIAVMLPLILRTNELIREDRIRLESLVRKIDEQRQFTEYEKKWLASLARQYGLKDIAADDVRNPKILTELYQRVDTIPPSLAIAQAAIESGWGTSRFALQGNAIYGQWTWNEEDAGIVPKKRANGENHRIRAFDFLIDSVRSYARNLNRNPAYAPLRNVRSKLRSEGKAVTGLALAPTLIRYSTRRDAYVADLRKIITGNRLNAFDFVTLEKRKGPLQQRANAGHATMRTGP